MIEHPEDYERNQVGGPSESRLERFARAAWPKDAAGLTACVTCGQPVCPCGMPRGHHSAVCLASGLSVDPVNARGSAMDAHLEALRHSSRVRAQHMRDCLFIGFASERRQPAAWSDSGPINP